MYKDLAHKNSNFIMYHEFLLIQAKGYFKTYTKFQADISFRLVIKKSYIRSNKILLIWSRPS